MNIHRLFACLFACVLTMTMYAVPALHVPCTLTLEDGRTVTAYLWGDENFSFYKMSDGTPIVRTANGGYRVTTREAISQMWAPRLVERNADRMARAAARRGAAAMATAQEQTVLHKKGIVILVNFKDEKMQSTSPAMLARQFNEVGYSENGHIGSVHDYFLEQSYGQLDLTFDVVGPYDLQHDMKYYGEQTISTNGNINHDKNAPAMIAEAIEAAYNGGVKFADYDWNGDKEVEQVFVVYANYSQAQQAPEDCIWPHEWALSSGYGHTITKDGITLNTYACSSELRGNSGTDLDGIGTACHEFSHCLGLPDMYDTSNSNNFGMSDWDLMDQGSYNGPAGKGSAVPSGYTAYERWYSGWLTPVTLSSGRFVHDMQPLTSAGEAYVIYNDNNKDEYFLLENRQKERWDAFCPGHGMLITHVDYDSRIWWNNNVNSTGAGTGNSHQRCTIVPADGLAGNDNGDPYPGSSGNTAFTDSSTPAACFYDGQSTASTPVGKPVTDITEVDGKISFTFMGGSTTSVPVAQEPIEVMPNAFIASWTAVDRATYTLDVQRKCKAAVPSEQILYSNDFNDKTADGGFRNVSRSGGRYQVGNSETTGTDKSDWSGGIFTTSINTFNHSSVTVTFDAEQRSGYDAQIGVTFCYENESGSYTYYWPQELLSLTTASNPISAHVVLPNPAAGYCVMIMVYGQAYIDNLKVYDGEYTPEELAEDAAYEVTNCLHQEDIDDTQFLVENVNPNDTYYYHVFADVDGSSSANSNTVEVDMPAVIASWPEVVLDDKSSTPPTEQWCRKVTLNRAFTAGKWFTVALPFDMDVPEGWTVQELTSTEGAGTSIMIHFREVDHMEAGKPYMGICNQDADGVEATMVKIVPNPGYCQNGLVTFIATNTVGKVPEGDYYIKDNKYYYAPEGGVNIQAFRAYFNVGNALGNTTHYTVDFDGSGMTLVDGLLMDDTPSEAIYDLTGRQMDNPTQGIYVVGGRKVFIR